MCNIKYEYKTINKHLLITLFFLPIFFIPGALLDSYFQGNLHLSSIALDDFIYPVLFSVLAMPLYGLLLSLLQTVAVNKYDESKIKWHRYEKLGKVKFLALRLFFATLAGFIASVITCYLFLFLVESKESFYRPISIGTYFGFAAAYILSNAHWDIHQQNKADLQTREC